MTAPLPLRFYNPVKELCEKVNLDYETVIGTGLSEKMRKAYLLADIEKELKDINSKDIKRVEHKIDFFNKKYGPNSITRTSEGEEEDKGCSRYNAQLLVESILLDDSQIHESAPLRNGLENRKALRPRNDSVWIPGRGVITRNEL